jgi:two-component system, OmpR family, sensor kinase
MSDLTPPAPFARGTLTRQLLLRVVALVAAAAVLLGLLTTLATRTLLLNQLDRQLDATLSRQQKYRTGASDADYPNREPPGGIRVPGQQEGTLAAEFINSSPPRIGVLQANKADIALPNAEFQQLVAQLQSVPVDGQPVSRWLAGDLGHYRLVAKERSYGVVVIGLPLNNVDTFLVELIGLEAVLAVLAMVGAVVAARAVVLRSLRPLNRVAATAQQVSQLPLDRGEVALAVRVPPADTDPRSEVGQVGQALNHMLNNVEEALAARQASEMKVRQFVADASHELRNPLAAIRGYAELTRRSGEQIPPDAAYAISRVESEAERMSRLVEDLLLLARLDAGPALDIQPTDLTELLLNAVSDARAAGPGHVWTLDLPEAAIIAPADAHRLYQVVTNLLANARTHTPAGTRVQTSLTLERDDPTASDQPPGRAVISVTDNGPGIAPELQDTVFQRFTRADTSRVRVADQGQGGSTGLGLAIVAAVVEAHAGTVSVQSRPGRTRFEVRLPLTAEAPAGAPDPAAG